MLRRVIGGLLMGDWSKANKFRAGRIKLVLLILLSVGLVLPGCKKSDLDEHSEFVTVEIHNSMDGKIDQATVQNGSQFNYSLERSGFERMAALYRGNEPIKYVEGNQISFNASDGHRIIIFPNDNGGTQGVYQAWKNAGTERIGNIKGPTLAHGTKDIGVLLRNDNGQDMPHSIWFNNNETIKYHDENGVLRDSGIYAVFDQINMILRDFEKIGSVTQVNSGANFNYGAGDCEGNDGTNSHHRIYVDYNRIADGKLDTEDKVWYLVRVGLEEAVENITAIDDPERFGGTVIGPRGELSDSDKRGLRWVFYKALMNATYNNNGLGEDQTHGTIGFEQPGIKPSVPNKYKSRLKEEKARRAAADSF